ncbi:MAG: biotin transporter BioY [Clostridiales bacterium]|nr:biotin transporter BioY [Clostridiales bacterium]
MAQQESATNENKRRKHNTSLDLAYIAIGAALITICSWISIPMAVPFTLQTFAVFTVLLLLGGRRGIMSILTYILMGAIGLPVFSGFAGGAGVLLGKTGGYILGFLFTAIIYLFSTSCFRTSPSHNKLRTTIEILALVLGLLVCYGFGTAWFMYIYMRDTGSVGLVTVLSWCVIPFILPDLLKMALAFIIAHRVRPIIK